MKRRLKRNICYLGNYAVLSKVEDLPRRRVTYIGDALEYARHFWTNHLSRISNISNGVKEVHEAIEKFFNINFLPCLEVLILTGNLEISVYALYAIERWCMLVSYKY